MRSLRVSLLGGLPELDQAIQVIDGDAIVPQPRPHRDQYTVVSFVSGKPVEGFELLLGSLQILDLDGDALSSDVITPPALGSFSDPLMTIDFQPVDNNQNRLWFSLTHLERVPEPASVLTLLCSAFLLAARGRASLCQA